MASGWVGGPADAKYLSQAETRCAESCDQQQLHCTMMMTSWHTITTASDLYSLQQETSDIVLHWLGFESYVKMLTMKNSGVPGSVCVQYLTPTTLLPPTHVLGLVTYIFQNTLLIKYTNNHNQLYPLDFMQYHMVTILEVKNIVIVELYPSLQSRLRDLSY